MTSLSRRNRRCAFAALAVTLPVLAVAAGWGARGLASDGSGAPAEERIPDFRLASLAGGEVGPETFAGRVVLYEFWATWCTPCHIQVEILKELYPRARAAGAEFVAVATGEPEEIVRRWAAEHPLPYTSLLDPDERLATALEVLGLPTLVVADASGAIVWRQTSLTDAETVVEALTRAGASFAD